MYFYTLCYTKKEGINMKHVRFFFLMTLMLTSCSESTVEQSNMDIQQALTVLKQQGFDTNDYIVIDNKILVEGDLAFDINQLLEKTSREKLRSKTHVTGDIVSRIPIYVDYTNLSSQQAEWVSIINDAISHWNNIPTSKVFFFTVNSKPSESEAHLTIKFRHYAFSNIGGHVEYNTRFSSNLRKELLISTNNYNLNRPRTEKIQIVVHELGHTIGLAHFDDNNATRIGDTNLHDSGNFSFMRININSFNGFTDDDVKGITTLWPKLTIESLTFTKENGIDKHPKVTWGNYYSNLSNVRVQRAIKTDPFETIHSVNGTSTFTDLRRIYTYHPDAPSDQYHQTWYRLVATIDGVDVYSSHFALKTKPYFFDPDFL